MNQKVLTNREDAHKKRLVRSTSKLKEKKKQQIGGAANCIFLFFFFFLIFLFCFVLFFRAESVAYGNSQARGQTRTTAAGLYHSHSNVELELSL